MTTITPLTLEEGRARRKMSIAIGLVLTFLAIAFYAVTLVRLQDNIAKRLELDAAASASAAQKTPVAPVNSKQGN